jgi:hypothetical protein
MVKLCLIGNSHAGALKLGWEIIKSEFPNCALTVFAAPGSQIDELCVRGSKLSPKTSTTRKFLKRTSGGEARIDTRNYDRFLVCGASNANALGRLLMLARIDTEPKDERQPLSLPLLRRIAEGDLRTSSAVRVVQKLREITDKPIGLIPKPLRTDEGEWFAEKSFLGIETPQKLADCFAAAARTIADSLNCALFFQPEVTKSAPLHTKRDYSKGSTKLLGGNRSPAARNVGHMNAKYGALVMGAILANPAWSGDETSFADAQPTNDNAVVKKSRPILEHQG